MAFALCFEELDVERLRREQEQANKDGPEAVHAQQEKAVEDAIVTIEAAEEEEESSDLGDSDGMGDPDADASGDSSDPGSTDAPADATEGEGEDPPASDAPEEDPAAEPAADAEADDKADEEAKSAQESFRHFGQRMYTVEDYLDYEAGAEVGEVISAGAAHAWKAGSWVVSGLANLGIEYGPTILKHLGKGVLFTVAKLAQGLGAMYEAFSVTLAKRKASVEALQKQLNDLKAALSAAKERQRSPKDQLARYDKTSVLDHIKIGVKTDPTYTLSVLNAFLDKVVIKVAQGAVDDLLGLKRISELAGSPT